MISIAQAFQNWESEIKPAVIAQYGNDDCALSESWNDYTDALCKDGDLCALQYHHCPAYDDTMPEDGSRWDALSGDRAFILNAMNVTLSAVFVPFSQSRNKSENDPSLNWLVTLKKGGREIITTDYMQGSAHCPAYNRTFNTPALNPATEKRRAIASECETGRAYVNGWKQGKAIDAPDLADVFHSLLRDGDAINNSDFADWCGDLGYDTDSINARATYDACLQIGLKLRGAFGDKTMRDLNELFEDM